MFSDKPYRSFIAQWLVLFALLLFMDVSQAITVVEKIRIWRAPESTRVVFNLSSGTGFRQYFLKSPLRLVLTLSHAHWRGKLLNVAPGGHFLRAVRKKNTHTGELQLIFDLKKPVTTDSFVLKPAGIYPHRLVVDLFGIRHKATKSKTRTSNKKNVSAVSGRAPIPHPRPRDIIVAIDAGHGGEDPGASGHRQTREKNVVLSIARRLQALLKKAPGLRPELTRRGDYFISLRGRTRMARKKKADLFVSIHADSFPQSSAHGSSVYALSRRGATSETGRWLANRENTADLAGGVRLNNKDSVVAKVLLDMSMTRTITDSVEFGKQVLKNLGRVVPLHSHKVEQAGFIVLKSPDIPSILIETAFISNRSEERKLRSPQYQNKIARAIFRGIKEYVRRYKSQHSGSFTAQGNSRMSFPQKITEDS